MSQSLFPFLQPQTGAEERTSLPLLREVKIDFTSGRPIFRASGPELVEGAEAVLTWAWMALRTPRLRHAIFSRAYGSEMEGLIGQPYTEALKQAEARRYLTEALMVLPYITGVGDIAVNFADGRMTLQATLETVYGRKEMTVDV